MLIKGYFMLNLQPNKSIVNGKYLERNERVKRLVCIDNEEVKANEDRVRKQLKTLAIIFYAAAVIVLIGGLYLASKI